MEYIMAGTVEISYLSLDFLALSSAGCTCNTYLHF